MALQYETLLLPCIVSITVALTWIIFLVKDIPTRLPGLAVQISVIIAWLSVAFFTVSLVLLISIMINILKEFNIMWAQSFILGWISLFASTAVISIEIRKIRQAETVPGHE